MTFFRQHLLEGIEQPSHQFVVDLVAEDFLGRAYGCGTDQEQNLRRLDEIYPRHRFGQIESDDHVGVLEQGSQMDQLGALAAAHRTAYHPLALRLEPGSSPRRRSAAMVSATDPGRLT